MGVHVSYTKAIAWISENDGTGSINIESISRLTTVTLVATIFKREIVDVAKSVARYRLQFLQKKDGL